MSDFILQAQAAAAQENWSDVVPLLQRIVLAETAPSDQGAWLQLLDLAMQVLQKGDFQEQWEVSKVFPALGQSAIAPLIALLEDETAELESRWFAARILGGLNHPDAIRALVEQLQSSEDEDLNQVVAEALANLGTPTIAALTELLATDETRVFAVQALTQIRHSETITPLLSVVNDPSSAIRAIALEALSNFRDSRIPEVLVRALQDSSTAVRKAAITGLSSRADLSEEWNLVALLGEALSDVNLGVCQQAALALGKLGQDAAIPWLQKALMVAPTPLPLQLDLLRALSWIGTQKALESLQTYLTQVSTHLSTPLYQEIFTLLGRWDHSDLKPIAAQILIDALETLPNVAQAATLRSTIATALGELKQHLALDPLIQLLADADRGVQLHAIAALKMLDPAIVSNRLEELQATSPLPERLQAGIDVALREWKTELPR
ncbi:MAG: HEAT repeat domain-containing protein [Leptolyngbyaceae cyanobacterium bins.302]|nr:HEAT repeat domain-containing protein [Leptolyngbyaceae cyanobacterium bins.302]